MCVLIKSALTAGVVYSATRLIPRKTLSQQESLIIAAASAAVVLALHFAGGHKPRVCRREMFVPDMTADEAGLVFGSVTKPPASGRVQDISYSGDAIALVMQDSRFIGKSASGDVAMMLLGADQTLSSLRIELYNADQLYLQKACKVYSAGASNFPVTDLMAVPLNSIVVVKHTSGGQDKNLAVVSGELLVNQTVKPGTTNHYFKLVDPTNSTDTVSVLRKNSVVAIAFAGDGAGSTSYLVVDTDGTVKTGATLDKATKFTVSVCTASCMDGNWRAKVT